MLLTQSELCLFLNLPMPLGHLVMIINVSEQSENCINGKITGKAKKFL